MFEIPTLLFAPALPLRQLCIFKVGSFFPSESRWALDFDCTCSSRSAGKTVVLVHMVGHAHRPSNKGTKLLLKVIKAIIIILLPHCHSHIAVWGNASILRTSPCNCHRILDLQFLLPPGPPLPSIAVPLQCAPVGQNLTSSF